MQLSSRDWALKAITSKEMAVIDRNAEFFGIPRRILMENAGRSVAEVIASKWSSVKNILVVAGLGDNGGDGIVCARYLSNWGFNVKVILLGRISDAKSELTSENLEILKYMINVEVIEVSTPYELLQYQSLFQSWCDVIVDAIIGTGIKGIIKEPQATAIDLINNSNTKKIAVDIPSGLDPDTGEVRDIAVKADITVTMHRPKIGLVNEEFKAYIGELIISDIGIPREAELIIGPGDMIYLKYPRELSSKKGDHGRVIIIGGSREFTGAPLLSAYSALKTGADLAIVLAPEKVSRDIRSQKPDLISIPLSGEYLSPEHVNEVVKYCEKADSIVIGPGLGLREETVKTCVKIIEELLNMNKNLVIDADAIKSLALTNRQDLIGKKVVITPHEEEFRLFTNVELKRLTLKDKIDKVMMVTREKFNGGVVLLKGNIDLITNGEKIKLNVAGNPGMTVGGTGDVLTGVIAGLMKRVQSNFEAACIGAFITGLTGDLVVKELGYHVTPSDLINNIPRTFKLLINTEEIIEKTLHTPVKNLLKNINNKSRQ